VQNLSLINKSLL